MITDNILIAGTMTIAIFETFFVLVVNPVLRIGVFNKITRFDEQIWFEYENKITEFSFILDLQSVKCDRFYLQKL